MKAFVDQEKVERRIIVTNAGLFESKGGEGARDKSLHCLLLMQLKGSQT